MYDPFSQEMSDARTSYTGTGLGLSIVKRMLDQMGGPYRLRQRFR